MYVYSAFLSGGITTSSESVGDWSLCPRVKRKTDPMYPSISIILSQEATEKKKATEKKEATED